MSSRTQKPAETGRKSEIGELRALLRSSDIQRDSKQYEQVVQKVIAYMTLGVDVSPLFSDMIMASATQNVVQKKMVYLYLSTYAQQNSELALLTVNTLRKDASDRNPMVRGLALRSMCSLRIPDIVEYIRQPLEAGLQDRSAYVRRTAVMGVVKLFYTTPSLITEMNLVDILYQMLRDQDPQVVCNCVSALDEILANEGGMVITKKIAHYLINKLHDFSEWGQCLVLKLLLRYKSADEEELFDILNVLDDRLKHVNCGVVLGTSCLFFHLTSDMPDIQEDVYDRIKTPLVTLLSSNVPELVYACLQHIEVVLFRQRYLFSKEYQSFFCRYNDPPYVKIKKLEVLMQICTEDNAQSIVEELGVMATDVSSIVAQQAIQAIGSIAVRVSSRANMCVDKLMTLLSMEIDHITSEVIIIMANILRKFEDTHETILPRILSSYDIMTNPLGKAALIWIIGEYGDSLPDSPYLLEDVVNHISEEPSSEVKLQLLVAVTKLFFVRPPECQEMLGRLLEYVVEEETDMLVRDRGLLYYRLLKTNVQEAKRIIRGSQKMVTQFTSPPKAHSLFAEFNTLAVMYSQPSSDFIVQEPPYILVNDSMPSRRDSDLEQMFVHGSSTGILPVVSQDTSKPEASLTGNLLDLEVPGEAETVEELNLNPSPGISAEEFEPRWLALPSCFQETLKLKRACGVKEVQECLAEYSVLTLASSPDNQPVMKMFLFAQEVSSCALFLVETVITAADTSLKLNIKVEDPNFEKQFRKLLLKALANYI